MTIASVGALAQSLVPGQPARKVSPALGLGFRFTVEIGTDSLLHLGNWQACSGLSVDFQPVEMKSGGDYLGTRYLAGQAKYGRVVLKRATSLDASARVQDWLSTYANGWLQGGTPTDVSAVITLYDSNDAQVMKWELSHVHPAGWKGPDLDATSSKVAVETLELVHGGFTVSKGSDGSAGSRTSPTAPAAGPTVLTVTGPGGNVVFQYAPVKVTVTRNQDATVLDPVTVDNQNATGGDAGITTTGLQLGAKPNVTAYTFNSLVLESAQVTDEVGKLLRWSTKSKIGANGEPVLPRVGFSLGSGLSGQQLNLTNLSVEYTRFDADGRPTRASITTLKLEEPKPDTARAGGSGAGAGATGSTPPSSRPGARNPTSGGIPGRGVHVLTQPESLPGLAQQTYGDAGAWRDIATANGIDDPLRVRPGTSLYLPARTEIGSR